MVTTAMPTHFCLRPCSGRARLGVFPVCCRLTGVAGPDVRRATHLGTSPRTGAAACAGMICSGRGRTCDVQPDARIANGDCRRAPPEVLIGRGRRFAVPSIPCPQSRPRTGTPGPARRQGARMPVSPAARIALLAGLLACTTPCPPAVAAPTGVWPLDPQPAVVALFDPPAGPYAPGHRGVDLLGRVGQPVRSVLAGTVTFAGSVAGRAVVTVDHGGRRTTYQPVVATLPVGAAVTPGTQIGTLTWRGSHCLPRACLHWGLIEGDDGYRDPLTLVGCGIRPVRLLPLGAPPPPDGCATAPSVVPAEETGHREVAQGVLRVALTLAGAPVGRPPSADPW